MELSTTIISLYDRFLSSENLIDIVIGTYEINHIIKYGVDSNGVMYNLMFDCETTLLIEFLCYSWASNIKATVFKRAIKDWICTQKIPYHIIPKKDYQNYVRKNSVLQCPERFDV